MWFLYSWLALAGHSLGSLEPCDEALQLLLLLQPQLSLQRSKRCGAQSVAGLVPTRGLPVQDGSGAIRTCKQSCTPEGVGVGKQ